MRQAKVLSDLVLGTGGARPGVCLVSPAGSEAGDVFNLPARHSVYALDVDFERRIVAAGSRAGIVEILAVPEDRPVEELRRIRRLVQGAPVLSVCLLDGSMLASTDAAGRCFVWRLSDEMMMPTLCENDNSIVCSVLPSDQGRIVGLSACGMLLWWDVGSGVLVHSVAVPRPPSRLAFVRLRSWPSQNVLVYPAAEGGLVVCKFDGSEIEVLPAHEGEFYAILAGEDAIHTIGAADGLLRTWKDPAVTASAPCLCPRGILSGDILADDSSRLLLVNDVGEAAIYAWDDDALRLQHRLDGDHYRAAIGPSPLVHHVLCQQHRMDRAERLIAEASERLDAHTPGDIEDVLGKLVDLGFESAALALRAQRAARLQDIIDELCARRKLTQTLPMDDPRSISSLTRLAMLLEQTWCLSEAKDTLTRIDPADAHALPWLAQAVEILAGEGWVAEPVHPVPLLIEVATITGRPFTGRWLVERADAIPFPDGTLTAEALAAKYEQIKTEKSYTDLPLARVEKTWWLFQRQLCQIDVIMLQTAGGDSSAHARPVVAIINEGLQHTLVPWVLFDAGGTPPAGSWHEHNTQVRAAYEQISVQGFATHWPRRLRQALGLAVQRLRNHAQRRWR